MKIIAHRGNLEGPNPEKENSVEYIRAALKAGFDVEVDVWVKNNTLWLGHDEPAHSLVDIDLLQDERIWVHVKNVDAARYCHRLRDKINFFWHQSDDFVLTSRGYFWTYPGKILSENSIAVIPETMDDYDYSIAYGVCTDFPLKVNQRLQDILLEKKYADYVYDCMYVEDYPMDFNSFKKMYE